MKIVFMTSGTIKSSLSYRPLSLAKELVKKGHEVHIFSPRFDKYSNFKDEKISEIDGVKISRPFQIKAFQFELGLIPYIISSAILLYKLNPDIVHINKPNPITLPGLFPHIIKKTPIILDVDDMDSKVMKIEKNPKLKIRLVEFSEKILAKQATAITTASKFLKKYYSKKYKNKKIVYIPNGAEFTNILNLSHQKISDNRVIFIGNINRINILEPLLISIKNMLDLNLKISVIIIGNGNYLNYFKKLAKNLKIEENIKFLGHVPQNLLSKYIEVGDIGYAYMPNELTIKACSSMKVFQYMQFGAIPLVSNVGDFPQYIFNGKAGYIAKHSNNKNLTDTIIKALKNKKERADKINYSKELAPKIFSWKFHALKIDNLYKSIIN